MIELFGNNKKKIVWMVTDTKIVKGLKSTFSSSNGQFKWVLCMATLPMNNNLCIPKTILPNFR